MGLANFFGRNRPRKPELGVKRTRKGEIVLPEGAPFTVSDPPGRFSMYVTPDALSLIEREGRITREELASLPSRIYRVAVELGLGRKEALHFILHVRDERLESESAASVGTIVPPIPAPNGDEVARTLVLFAPPFRFDMNGVENYFAEYLQGAQGKTLAPERIESLRGGVVETRRSNCVTLLCHEMVHLFVTDESMPRFKGWTLSRLEMLTDAITVRAVYPIVERSQDDFVRIGFTHGAAYLSNSLQKTRGDTDHAARVVAMKELAEQIIREEQKALAH